MKKEYLDPKIQEEMFREALAEWERDGSEDAWHRMWERVAAACKACALRIAPGKPLILERSMDAAITIMKGIKERGSRPQKLSSFVYWPVRGSLQGRLAQQEDQELQYDPLYEEQTQLEHGTDTIRGIYRPEMNGGKEIE